MKSLYLLGPASVGFALLLAAAQASAQANAPTAGELEGVPVPTAPATVARTSEGLITLRAVRLEQPLVLDGALDEELYRTVQPASNFVQQYPRNGDPATEDTDVWVFFDADHVYISLRAWDSQPDQIVANEMRRDNINIWLNDNIIVALDTYLDRRSAFFFQTNPLGGVRDALIVNEQTVNYDWNTVWDVKSRRNDQGWTAEMAIPFKSLRYSPGSAQVWGLNVMRAVRSKNELTLLSPVPSTYNTNGIRRLASAATLFGIEAPPASRNMELRPYAISTLTTNRPTGVSNELDADFGIDARYGLTSSMTLDLTYNTDFAQVEIDEQQVNLTRFGLALPEKREFFLEGQGIFDFAGTGGGGGSQAAMMMTSPVPQVFFSRRIGLDGGSPVPIQGGARVMGRAGPLSMGVLGIRTEEVPGAGITATNYSVARVKADVLSQSSVGMVVTHRTPSLANDDGNLVLGADANLTFFDNLRVAGYFARSSAAPTLSDPDPSSYRANVQYDTDRFGVQLERLKVGDAFNPEVGFLRRGDFHRTFGQARISSRPAANPFIRRLSWDVAGDRFESSANELESQQERGSFGVEFHSSDMLTIDVARNFEELAAPFMVAGGLVVPVGSYRFYDAAARLSLGSHRKVSGNVNLSRGEFFTGHRTGIGYSGRVEITPQFAVEPRVSADWISLPEGERRVTLIGARPTFTVTPRMYVSALTQYNSSTGAVESNLRWRWEFQPGSDLFVVYTDGRDGNGAGIPDLINRGLAIKVTRFFRF